MSREPSMPARSARGDRVSARKRSARGPLGQEQFRRVMGHYPTGVTIVTALGPDGTPVGLTANSVTSVSLDPPLVLVCVSRESASLRAILAGGAFAVNILGAGAAPMAVRFAEEEHANRFADVAIAEMGGRGLVLDGVVAWVTCDLYRTFEAGDHLILVGEVNDGEAAGGDPLVFFRSRYRDLRIVGDSSHAGDPSLTAEGDAVSRPAAER